MTRPPLDSPELRAWRDASLYRLLLRASRAETSATLEAIRRVGFDDVSLVDTNLLANLDTGGTTISALARRAGVTRQAASQQVAALVRSGYVQTRASKTDGRATVVIQTAKGRKLLDTALDVVEDLERSYADVLGAKDLAALKRHLTVLLEHIDPTGTLGPD